jgi:hypothetical protein
MIRSMWTGKIKKRVKEESVYFLESSVFIFYILVLIFTFF